MNWLKTAQKLILVAALIGASSLLYAKPHAFPVPFVAKQHNLINFQDLPGEGSIKIFTISGEKVVELLIGPGQGLLQWDVKNTDGDKLSTGVYLFLVDGGGQQTRGKLVVIR